MKFKNSLLKFVGDVIVESFVVVFVAVISIMTTNYI